jgi:glycosyltransferase involved in cell wall biosynthesis
MQFRLFRKTVRDNFVIIDSQFPQKEPMGFRNTEINEYFRRLKNVKIYAMYPMKPEKEAWFSHGYGVDERTYETNKLGYLKLFPQNKTKIHHLNEHTKYRFKLAYSFFLAETYTLLPFYEKNHIPFVFILYPGGAFGLNNEASDAMLRRICDSQYFRGVIVSQKITKDYLLKKKICKAADISYVYGGFVQFNPEDVRPKQRYLKEKKTFDVCFVAAKYTDKGIDKGYDAFIAAAKIIAKQTSDVRFHVIGNFDKTDIDVAELGSKITFYGYQKPDFFPEFYARMDIMLSPNRPFKLFDGNFDGFPLGVDAGYCGTAMFVSDELAMNEHFTDGKDIVIVKVNAKQIANKVMKYYNNTDSLYELSEKGRVASHRFFSIETQISGRLKVFRAAYKRETTRELE